jgi:CRP/FNR family transcriptional regulator
MRYVFREMNHEQTMMLVLGKMSANRRLAHFLLDISSRLSKHGLSASNINLTMTRHDIGNYLGLAVETVSRLLTRFEKNGFISVQRRQLKINDMYALQHVYDQNEHSTLKEQRVN